MYENPTLIPPPTVDISGVDTAVDTFPVTRFTDTGPNESDGVFFPAPNSRSTLNARCSPGKDTAATELPSLANAVQ